ncbi:MAG TPA: ATP-binding cassette domain-containing protein [Longimicrobiales bacterium]
MQLELNAVSLRFGQVEALRDISLRTQSGEVTCLLGDNGAGKSSVIRVLSGVHRPTSGSYSIDGHAVHLASPRDALARGIATVHQDLGLIPLMSVWRNFVLGGEPTAGNVFWKRIDIRSARTLAVHAMAELGITVNDVDQPVGNMSGGERQSLAIARAMQRGARILILDEPTAALAVKQAEIVLGNVVKTKARGIGVVLVTHNPEHAYRVGDSFVVLRQGRVVARVQRSDADAQILARLMSGTDG